MPNEAHIALSDLSFEPVAQGDDPAARLLATVNIAGTPHYLEAFAVRYDESVQRAESEDCDSMLGDLGNAFGSDGAFRTVTIDDREYVLFLSPAC